MFCVTNAVEEDCTIVEEAFDEAGKNVSETETEVDGCGSSMCSGFNSCT